MVHGRHQYFVQTNLLSWDAIPCALMLPCLHKFGVVGEKAWGFSLLQGNYEILVKWLGVCALLSRAP